MHSSISHNLYLGCLLGRFCLLIAAFKAQIPKTSFEEMGLAITCSSQLLNNESTIIRERSSKAPNGGVEVESKEGTKVKTKRGLKDWFGLALLIRSENANISEGQDKRYLAPQTYFHNINCEWWSAVRMVVYRV